MSDERLRLEHEIRSLALDLDTRVAAIDLSGVVSRHVDRLAHRTRRRRVLAAVLAVGAVIGIAPPARAAVVDIIHVGVERIHHSAPPHPLPAVRAPAGSTALPGLGSRVTLAQAHQHLHAAMPTLAGYTTPTAIWFTPRGGGQLSLVYAAGDRLPAAPGTGIGLLVQEYAGDGRMLVGKYVQHDTQAEEVHGEGFAGVFIHGGPHGIAYYRADGTEVDEAARLAGTALVIQRGELTIRIEGELPRDQMVAIAASLR